VQAALDEAMASECAKENSTVASQSKQTSRSQAELTESSLPLAVGSLFKMNNYEVDYDIHVHGAQIDIIAKSKGDPFAPTVYIEATIEHVSTEKYGKDTTKFLLLARKDPAATLICVSSKGFTAFVKERAKESGVVAISYDELFAKFEKFTPYIDYVLLDNGISRLLDTYEEPLFNDAKGIEQATAWLGSWRLATEEQTRWLIVLGEYGTGKTTPTKVLQHRWLEDYRADPTLPIPIRIELRNFTRQFDATGLLHHFLDTNKLSHVPIEFMVHLIKTGRVIMLLDGYDEMAQFMNSRERRACLGALADLAKDGAKGILTSRPNYFSETEELNVFEALYRSLEQQRYHVSKADTAFLQQEKSIDQLIERYVLYRYERNLQDLTPEQTTSLVRRSLSSNPRGQEVVLSILNKVFREEGAGRRQSLSGKPVIIAYLLELVADLERESLESSANTLTEWGVYRLIIDQLMLRDVQRSALHPSDRRRVLQRLAIKISSRDTIVATEQTFMEVIEEQFSAELRRLPGEDRRIRRVELFEDLRSSATLTRAAGTKDDGWIFSHNSLREYLSAETFVSALKSKSPTRIEIPITAAMRAFVASLDATSTAELWQMFGELWPQRGSNDTLGAYLALLWDSSKQITGRREDALSMLGRAGPSKALLLSDISIKDINFSLPEGGDLLPVNASSSSLTDIRFDRLSMQVSNFEGVVADAVSFRDCDLSGSSFHSAFLHECDVSGANVTAADFQNLDPDSSILVTGLSGQVARLSGQAALGYLQYSGAHTDPVDDIYIFKHHAKFAIVKKVCEKLSEQKNNQLRGLTQRGEARADPRFARELVTRFVNLGWVEIDRNELVSATSSGRPVLQKVSSEEYLASEIVQYLRSST